MKISDRDKSYVWDVVEASGDILDFISGLTWNDFSSNKMVRYAVERQLIVIGEASAHLSKEFRDITTDVPWTRIIGLRNIIAHDYGEVLAEKIWIVATRNIQELRNTLEKFIRN